MVNAYNLSFNFEQNTTQPIKITPISQYTCHNYGNPSNFSNNHYYFSPFNSPPSIPPNETQHVCHNKDIYGEEDSPLYPRLNLKEGIFSLWSINSKAFFDLNNNGKTDVNDYVETRLLFEYGINTRLNLFASLRHLISPIEAETTLGYYMMPFVSSNTGLSFCPTYDHYNSGEPIFSIIQDVIGVETEAIYLSKRERFSLVKTQPNNDYLLITETKLKQVWFYIENGQYIQPNEQTASYHNLYFFYPLDLVNPYVKKPGQNVYTITRLQNAQIQTSDKRIGCIPKLN